MNTKLNEISIYLTNIVSLDEYTNSINSDKIVDRVLGSTNEYSLSDSQKVMDNIFSSSVKQSGGNQAEILKLNINFDDIMVSESVNNHSTRQTQFGGNYLNSETSEYTGTLDNIDLDALSLTSMDEQQGGGEFSETSELNFGQFGGSTILNLKDYGINLSDIEVSETVNQQLGGSSSKRHRRKHKKSSSSRKNTGDERKINAMLKKPFEQLDENERSYINSDPELARAMARIHNIDFIN